VLEACVDIEARQADVVTRICDGPLITVADLKQEEVFQWLLAPESLPARTGPAPSPGGSVPRRTLLVMRTLSGM
jgi:hypothetical protein